MSQFFINATQFVLSLSILIVLHELGHFIPARAFKIRVEKFYLFFDPYFSLFKKKIGDTEYGIGWLPLGGYVKISGMIDESMDTEQMKQPAKPWEFRSKPAWQRLIIMVGGVTVNVILAFVIYAMLLFTWGKEYLPNENLIYGVQGDSLVLSYGFQNGDRILQVGEVVPKTLNEVNQEILFGDAREILVERNGSQARVVLSEDFDQEMLASGAQSIFAPRYPNTVDSVLPKSFAEQAGLKEGDQIASVNGVSTTYFDELIAALQAHREEEVELGVLRNGEIFTTTAQTDTLGRLGFTNKSGYEFFETVKQDYGFIESFPAGVREGSAILVGYVRSLKLAFTGEGVKQMGGFHTIAKLYGTTWDWRRFWSMTALLSIILAVMNMLPIPALDGGHVMFLLYEMIAGRAPNQKFMEYAQLAGIALLITLMIYANGMDLVRGLFS